MGETATYGLAAVARRAAVLAGVWVILVEGRPGDSLVGLPVAVALALYSLRLSPPRSSHAPMRPWPLLGLAPRLVRLSLVGGFDVAMRALRRPPDLDPAMVVYPLDPPHSGVAVGLSVILTLMPGTLAAEVAEDSILIHVLDRTQDVAAQLQPLEDGLRRGLGTPPRNGGGP